MFRFLINKRYVDLLFMVGDNKNIHKLSREPKINMTISHLSNVTNQWKKEGLIIKRKMGRETEMELTEFGIKFSKVLRELYSLIIGQLNKIKQEVNNGTEN